MRRPPLSLLAIVLVVLVLAARLGGGPAGAHAPHPGLDFALAINVDRDGDNDCGTGVPRAVGNGAPDSVPVQVTNTTCEVQGAGGLLRVNVYLIDNAGLAAGALSAHLTYSGIASSGRGESVWDGCAFEATASGPDWENAGCTIAVAPAPPLESPGLIATFDFTCATSGTITLAHGAGETVLADDDPEEHREAGSDMLSVECAGGPSASPGDSDCSGSVNSIDAALILQDVAGLLSSVPCPAGADANSNGRIDAIDAALVLQFSAGLISEL